VNGVVRLILVRHGEAVANMDMRYLGSRDDVLTERGVWQAAQLGQFLAPYLWPAQVTAASSSRNASCLESSEARMPSGSVIRGSVWPKST